VITSLLNLIKFDDELPPFLRDLFIVLANEMGHLNIIISLLQDEFLLVRSYYQGDAFLEKISLKFNPFLIQFCDLRDGNVIVFRVDQYVIMQ